jgi:hypothetical protein
MSNWEQAVLSIGGAIVGFFVGGPTGAAWGYQIGGAAGSALFPTDLGTVSGPRLNDLTVQSSAVGAPIPIVYGTYAIAGNLIWSGGIEETVTKRRQGGKGGPTQTVKEYTYSVSCAVGLCEGPIQGIRRIWADTKLIYDARPQLEDETTEAYNARVQANSTLLNSMEIYLGGEDQLADPTIQSYEGSGNVSAFRGLAYVVFTDFWLTDYGNRVPNFRFEVSGASVPTTVGLYSAGWVPHWEWQSVDPRPFGAALLYNQAYGDFTSVVNLGAWTADLPSILAARGVSAGGVTYSNEATAWTDVVTSGPTTILETLRGPYWPSESSPPKTAEPNNMLLGLLFCVGGNAVAKVFTDNDGPEGEFGGPPVHVIPDTYNAFAPHVRQWVAYDAPNEILGNPATPVAYHYDPAPPEPGQDPEHKLLRIYDTLVVCARQWEDPVPLPSMAEAWSEDLQWFLFEGWWLHVDTVWEELDDGLAGLRVFDFGPGWPSNEFTTSWFLQRRPLEYGFAGVPRSEYLIPADDPRADSQEFWDDLYAAAVAAGHAPSGWTYENENVNLRYPNFQSYAWGVEFDAYETDPTVTTIGTIVRDVCRRCGLTSDQIDVSDLTQPVWGYAISRVMNGRDAISPLRSLGMFDCVESAGVLKWPTRGKAAVATLTDEDLGAHSAGDQRPAAMQVTRTQEVELPRRLRVHYAQSDMNYEQGEQSASRLSVGTDQVQDVELAVAMGDNRAAQTAEVLLYDAWVSRNRYETTVDHSFLALEPADAIEAPVDGRMERLRIVDIDYSLPGLQRLALVRDDEGVYTSYAIGAPAAYSGTTGSNISIPGTATLLLLDLPMLRDEDNDAGYYAAVTVTGGTSFAGLVVYRSPDGGTTYDSVATITQQATVGELSDALPAGPTTIIDEGNELLVEGLETDALESISEASLLAGLNAAAIGADGRWEIIQFRDAELTGSPPVWRLTGLLRGRRGTEWAMGLSQPGDAFVLLDSAIVRVPMNVAAIGAERQHKGVLVGTSLESTTAQAFTGEGVALECFAPVNVEGAREAGDLTISWTRRDRFGQELPSGTDIPMSEPPETYEVDILSADSPPEVLRTLTSSATSVTYTEAQQAEDFGSPVPESVTVRVYQLSATVGRGYPAEATV